MVTNHFTVVKLLGNESFVGESVQLSIFPSQQMNFSVESLFLSKIEETSHIGQIRESGNNMRSIGDLKI